MNGYGRVKDIATYVSLSPRTVWTWLKQGLRFVKLPGGTVLIRYEWVDQYLEQFADTHNRVDQIVEETLKEFKL
jgi:excisionase family DNA binding protein